MDSPPRLETLWQVLQRSVRIHAARDALGTRKPDGWQWVTYESLGAEVDKVRGGLASLGVKAGDRVAIISDNRIEWAAAAFACYSLGAIFVPMYEAQSPTEWEFIVRESEASVVLIANDAVLEKAQNFAAIDTISTIVVLDPGPTPASAAGGSKRVTSYAALLDAPAAPGREPDAEDVAVLIYTSGTMGVPKGVPLSHFNITSNLNAIHEVFHYEASDRSLAFLPWAHVYGQTAELYMLLSCGSSVAICDGPDRILDRLAEVRPTVLIGVPRVFNRVYVATQQQLARRPKWVQDLVSTALVISSRQREGRPPKPHERWLLKLVDQVVFTKVRARLGGRIRIATSGGAALSLEVSAFLDSIGIEVYDGYGLTETSPVVSTNVPGARRVGTVGRCLPGVRVAIERRTASEGDNTMQLAAGELIVYGPNVMKSYFKRAPETAAAFTADGGFRTGDLGVIDADGYLSITGRIKEAYKLENGKYVVPSPLEEMLKLSPYVSNVFVYGDGRPFNIALVVANIAAVRGWAKAQGLELATDLKAMLSVPRVRNLFDQQLSLSSETFKRYEAIANYALLEADFTIESGMLTPKLSLKRARILEAYRDVIEQLYRDGPRAAARS